MFKPTRHSLLALCVGLASLVGCASHRPEPKALLPFNPTLGVRTVWSGQFPTLAAEPTVVADSLVLATATGKLIQVEVSTGKPLVEVDVGSPLRSGVGAVRVGTDWLFAAVTERAELVMARGGKVAWRQALPANVVTRPLLAGGRVFVLTTARSLLAFDQQDGRKLWQIQQDNQALALSSPTVLMPYRNTLLVGLGAKLARVNPDTGDVLSSIQLASNRGANEVERLVELADSPVRWGDTVCVRAFQISVSCVSMEQGKVLWSTPASGFARVVGDGETLFTVDADSKLRAWSQTGELRWLKDTIQWRDATSPLQVGDTVMVGDASGTVHFFDKQDGRLRNRIATDGSPIRFAPVVSGQTVVVATQKGKLFAYEPE